MLPAPLAGIRCIRHGRRGQRRRLCEAVGCPVADLRSEAIRRARLLASQLQRWGEAVGRNQRPCAPLQRLVQYWRARATMFRPSSDFLRLAGHQNRSYPIGIAFSPCMRFVAAGSEDKTAYVFDLRQGAVLHRLPGFTDVVSDVSFHPQRPQLVACCLSGKVRFFFGSQL